MMEPFPEARTETPHARIALHVTNSDSVECFTQSPRVLRRMSEGVAPLLLSCIVLNTTIALGDML